MAVVAPLGDPGLVHAAVEQQTLTVAMGMMAQESLDPGPWRVAATPRLALALALALVSVPAAARLDRLHSAVTGLGLGVVIVGGAGQVVWLGLRDSPLPSGSTRVRRWSTSTTGRANP